VLESGELGRFSELIDEDIDFWLSGEAFSDLRHEELDEVEAGDTIALELRGPGHAFTDNLEFVRQLGLHEAPNA
jgi:hypothetical protein